MLDYIAYGLGIHSAVQLPIPGLTQGTTTTDVVIRRGEVNRTVSEIHNSDEFLLRADATEVCYFNPNLGAFLIREGREIIVDGNPDVEERMLGQFILNLPLPMVLHQRGLLVLHASAVAVNGVAVAFLGQSGQGKSTTAAALHQRNYPLITDDVLVVEIDGTAPGKAPEVTVFPSYPQQRLWLESITSLGEVPETWLQVYPNYEKRARSVASGFCEQPLPLKRIYVLEVGNCLAIEPLNPTEAFQEIASQSYPTTEVSKAMDKAVVKFQQCVRLVNCVSICRLQRPHDFSTLSKLVRFIEEDIAELPT